METSSILDLASNYVDSRARLGPDLVRELQTQAESIYADWAPPPRRAEEIRLLPGLTVRHKNEFIASSALGTSVGRSVIAEAAIYPRYEVSGLVQSLMAQSRAYGAAFLYADTVVEPLHHSLFLGASRQGDVRPELSWTDLDVKDVLETIAKMRPLVEAGVLILTPPLAPNDALRSKAVDQDQEHFSDYLGPREHELDFFWDGLWTSEEFAMQLYDLLRLIHLAAQTEATFVPCEPWHWAYIDYLGRRTPNRGANDTNLAVNAGLASVDLPILRFPSPAELAKIRTEEDAFVQWRIALREAARLIRAQAGSPTFEREAQEILTDFVVSRGLEVRRATSRSPSLRAAIQEQAVRVGLGVAIGSGATLTAGGTITDVVMSALVASLTNLAYASVRPVKPTGAAGVLSFLESSAEDKGRT
jgi:hypothetical protein